MKLLNLITFSVFFFFASSSYAQWGSGKGELSGNSTKGFKWDKTSVDLGEVEYGSSNLVSFKFTNTSGKPILITNAKGSCGCTKIEYPRKPIMPNKTITVTVTYEADDIGVFNKTVNLTMNIEQSRQTLHIKGEVKS